tara:strand:+ start:3366 stop:3716 length:351 start_codon:yes stop_codon:yes gene_type:complete
MSLVMGMDMSFVLDGWQQGIVLQRINEISDGAGGFDKTYTDFAFKGVITCPKAKDLEILPEGQRQWAKWQIHTKTQISAEGGDSVKYNNMNYKIINKTDNSSYGFYRYFLIEEFER